MALIKCSECGHMISDKAQRCPKCGAPVVVSESPMTQTPAPTASPYQKDIPEHTKRSKSTWLYILLGILAVLLIILVFVVWKKYSPTSSQDESINAIQNDSTVKEESALSAWSKEDAEFAKKTGLWQEGLSDAKLAERMSDSQFRPWLQQRFLKFVAKNVRATDDHVPINDPYQPGNYGTEVGTYGVTVINNMDVDFKGQDYKLIVKFYSPRVDEYWTATYDGEDIPAHGSAIIPVECGFYDQSEQEYVNTVLTPEQLFDKYYQPTGNEYNEYLKEKK